MRKFVLLPLVFLCAVVSVNAQLTRLQARDAEWKSYALPQTNFVRQTNPDNDLIFRVPADWKRQNSLIFDGPHSAKLTVYLQKVPDGYPLQDYFSATLRVIRDTPG